MSKTRLFSMHNKDKILHAASALFVSAGVGALSVRSIAQKAGLSTIGIYSHFKGKQGIVDALFIDACEKLHLTINAAQGNNSTDKVIDACERIVLFSESHRAHYQLIFDNTECHTVMSDEASQAYQKLNDSLVTLAAMLPKKMPSESKASALGTQIWALIHGFISLSSVNKIPHAADGNWQDKAVQAVRLHVYAIVATQ